MSNELSVNLIVIDNFYENPYEIRDFAIKKLNEYQEHQYHPGKRTEGYATEHHKTLFNKILNPYCGNIIDFDVSKNTNNGSFQYNISTDRSWIHTDNYKVNWAGIIYLTPNAPLSAGTSFFKHKDGNINLLDTNILKNENVVSNDKMDVTKWDVVSNVGNLFNRLILFRANQYHMSCDYFGNNINDGRLIQLFFFTTEN